MELSPKRASSFETNTNIQESAAIESLGKDLVAVSENFSTRDIAAHDLMEKTLATITGENTPLKVVKLGESHKTSLI